MDRVESVVTKFYESLGMMGLAGFNEGRQRQLLMSFMIGAQAALTEEEYEEFLDRVPYASELEGRKERFT